MNNNNKSIDKNKVSYSEDSGKRSKGLPTSHNRNSVLQARIVDILWVLIINLLLFSVYFEHEVSALFAYVDETVVLGIAMLAVIKSAGKGKSGLTSTEIFCIVTVAVFEGLGLIGNVVSQVQGSIWAIGVDTLACSKFFIALFASVVLFDGDQRLIKMLQIEAKILIPIVFAFAFANIFVDIGMSAGSMRYGLRPFSFIFYHPSIVVWMMVSFVALLMLDRKKNYLYIVMALLIVCLTLRSKGICWAAFMAFMLLTLGKRNKFTLPQMAICLIAVAYFGLDQFMYYYSDDASERSRGAMLLASFEIAGDYFPWGTGFGTFGSAITETEGFYSPLYYSYGLNTVYGLQPYYTAYITDSFWSTVLAQFGVIGLILFVAILVMVYRMIKERAGHAWLAPSVAFIYIIIGSLGETAFFSPNSVLVAIIIAALLRKASSFYKSEEASSTSSKK